MGVTASLTDNTTTTPRSGPANTCLYLGVSSAGSLTEPFECTDPSLIPAGIGYGNGPEVFASAVRNSRVRQVFMRVEGVTAGAVGAFTQSASGPLITAAGAAYHDLATLRVKVTRAGANAVGGFKVAEDGYTYGAERDIPAAQPATLRGTVDLTGLTLSTLNGLTLIVDPHGLGDDTCTFTTPSSVADIATQITTQIAGLTASIVEGRYLLLTDATTGVTSTLAVSATSTAEVILGLSTTLVAGSAATHFIPNTNITVTFPTGTYVLDEVYTAAATAPRYTTTAMATALAAARNAGIEFGDVVNTQTPVDAAEALSFAQALTTAMEGWQSGTPYKPAHAVTGTPLGSTGSSGITTNDTAVKNAFNAAGHESNLVTVAHGDCYFQGTFIPGSHRRPLVFPLGVRMGAHRLSEDPGSGGLPSLPDTSLVSPDGVTKARDEETASVKMRAQKFTVARTVDSTPRIARGVTRAASSSKFRHLGVIRMAMELLRVGVRAVKIYENQDDFALPTGKLQPSQGNAMNQAAETKLRAALVDPGHASAVKARVDKDEIVTQTDNLTWVVEAQHKAQFETVIAKFSVVSTIDLS